MSDQRPGLNFDRLVRLMREAVARCQLNLSDREVFTEAATGAYVVTPVLAAMAGASRVYALTRSTPYGTVGDVAKMTHFLADKAGVSGRIHVVTDKQSDLLSRADIITNSGHVRPIDRQTVQALKSGATVPLMYESWELRPGEVDLLACQEHGIRVGGTNERHPNIDVFSYLGVMAVKLLLDAGIAVYQSRVLVVCDNPFASFIRRGLEDARAQVEITDALTPDLPYDGLDAILVATKPRSSLIIGHAEAERIAARCPCAVICQYWGEIDRDALDSVGLTYWPPTGPKPGHMGVLPSAVGPEPIIRLQAGGLKVAEVLLSASPGSPDWEYVDAV